MPATKQAVLLILIICTGICPVAAAGDPFSEAGRLYDQSVDLANEGKFEAALAAADEALALNATSLTALIQTNRAGILNVLGRYDEAIAAADAALAVRGNLTTAHAIAYYNKGDALRRLGRTDEAGEAFDKARELDSTLVAPDLTAGTTATPAGVLTGTPALSKTPAPTPAFLPAGIAVIGCAAGALARSLVRKRKES